ncbi:MAG: AraC family transcriptional regulator [Roseiarcus sp.]
MRGFSKADTRMQPADDAPDASTTTPHSISRQLLRVPARMGDILSALAASLRGLRCEDASVCVGLPSDIDEAELETNRDLDDSVVRQLRRTLEVVDKKQSRIDDVYASAVRLAIASRLLSLRSDRSITGPASPRGRRKTALPRWRARRVVEYVDAHLDEPISLSDLGAAAGLSRNYFAAQFRVATGLRPHEFLLRGRIERAQKMLVETNAPLAEIAFSIGFRTQSHFSTVFKRLVGWSPYRWRDANKRETSVSENACGVDSHAICLTTPIVQQPT